MRRPASRPACPRRSPSCSLGGFGDVQGTGVAAQYLAQRDGAPGTPGWTTHAITPAQDPGTLKGVGASLAPGYDAEMSDDLTKGVFRAWTPLTDAPNVAQVTDNLYVREDLRTPGPGSYRLLTDATTLLPPASPSDPFLRKPRVAAATEDFQHVLFETNLNLTADAVGNYVKLYKTDGETVRLIAAGPGCPGSEPGQCGGGRPWASPPTTTPPACSPPTARAPS